MRFKILLILLGLFIYYLVSAQLDNSLLKGKWIAVEYRQNDTVKCNGHEGIFLNFNNMGMDIFDISDGIIEQVEYPKLDSINSADSIFFYTSRDSLILGDSVFSYLFIPLKIAQSGLNFKKFNSLLTNHTWVIDKVKTDRIRFSDNIFVDFLFEEVNIYLTEDSTGCLQYKDIWYTYTFRDNLHLVFWLEENYQNYQILDFEENKIFAINCNSKSLTPIVLSSLPDLTDFKRDSLFSIITSKTWKTQEKRELYPIYNSTGRYYNIDSIGDPILPNILHHSRNYPGYIKYSIFGYKYLFNKNGTYSIKRKKKIINQGEWELSSNGHYIILDPSTVNEYFINILKISNETLIIGKPIALRFDRNSDEKEVFNFKIVLK